MDYMRLYKDFNHLWSPMKHPDNTIGKEMLIKDEYYIWNPSTTIILFRFEGHHSEYAILAKIIIYNGVMQSEDDIPQVLGTSGGIFYKLNNF
jgi:hypothetical protein